MAGAVFGDLAVSFFVADAVFGEIWVDSRSATRCNFQYKMRCRGGNSKLRERTGSVFQFHGRIMFGSWSNRPRIGNDASTVFANFSYILECNFAWQAQCLVRLEGDACCSAHCK